MHRWPEELGTMHGVEHWDRVAHFGRFLYEEGADMDVIMVFAYLHDSRRLYNDEDEGHGLRASELVDEIRDSYLEMLDSEQIEILKRACELHNTVHKTGNKTIDICFDADRMDLQRVGILPMPERMATKRGAEIVSNPRYKDNYNILIENNKMG